MSRECLVMLQNFKKSSFPRLLEIFFSLQLHKRRKNFQGYLEFKGVVIIQNAIANLNKGILYLSETSPIATGCLLGLLSIKQITVYYISLLPELADFCVSIQSQCKEWQRKERNGVFTISMWQCILGTQYCVNIETLTQLEINNLSSVWQILTRIAMYLSVNQKFL